MISRYIATVLVALGVSFSLLADSSDAVNQEVSLGIPVFKFIKISGDPRDLVLKMGAPGSNPDPVSDNSTSYAITVNENNLAIFASLDENMPTGTELALELKAPTGAVSQGFKKLSTSPVVVVDDVDAVSESGMRITYKLSANAQAEASSGFSRTVTITILSR